MPVKDTHSYSRSAGGQIDHSWTEETEHVYTQLRIDDEADSVTFVTNSRSKGIWAPSVEVEIGVRMTYSDLAKLIALAQEILNERTPDDHDR
ncbi:MULTISPECIES: hypothetical protein [unclassified Streptomyces]|uniref:hypothetical protein n=1 Tax=unclassified Streptomyces TaxID=2593676 RepID=UPI003D8FE9A9